MSDNASNVVKALGKTEAIEVLRILSESNQGLGFNQLKNELRTDPKTLTRRLDELGEFGIVTKGEDDNYHLTSTGSRVLKLTFEIADEVNGARRDNLVQ